MSARGSPAWYRRNDSTPLDPEAERARRRAHARANGMFDEYSERPAFEGWFRDSRRGKGATFLAMALERLPEGAYRMEATQRHWWTWQHAVGAGRLLPKYDPYKLAADRLAASAQEAHP